MKFFPRTTNFFDSPFDDLFDSSFFKSNRPVMKTDICEKDDTYVLDIELPGCKKEDIKMELQNGYLSIHASRNTNKEEKDEQGNVIRLERYQGSCERSFYVGDDICEEDIKAAYHNGELKITIPKKEAKLPEKKFIEIA